MKKFPAEMEADAYKEIALLYAADIEDPEVLDYAILTCAVRYRLAGVSASFLEATIDKLGMATKIDI